MNMCAINGHKCRNRLNKKNKKHPVDNVDPHQLLSSAYRPSLIWHGCNDFTECTVHRCFTEEAKSSISNSKNATVHRLHERLLHTTSISWSCRPRQELQIGEAVIVHEMAYESGTAHWKLQHQDTWNTWNLHQTRLNTQCFNGVDRVKHVMSQKNKGVIFFSEPLRLLRHWRRVKRSHLTSQTKCHVFELFSCVSRFIYSHTDHIRASYFSCTIEKSHCGAKIRSRWWFQGHSIEYVNGKFPIARNWQPCLVKRNYFYPPLFYLFFLFNLDFKFLLKDICRQETPHKFKSY